MGSENDKEILPDDSIYEILSRDTLAAVKTSTLSSRWRFIWTKMKCLAFSSEDFPNLPKFSKFVKHVLSGRDNQTEVSSVKLTFREIAFVKKILDYAFSHNIQQLDITYLVESDVEFALSLFSSQTLKHLNFKRGYCGRRCNQRGSVTLTSRWVVPALTTLHLDGIMLSRDNTDNFSGLITKCVNLKNLTLTSCKMAGSDNIDFNISHSQLSNLTIDEVPGCVRLLTVVAPELKNLIIKKRRNSSSRIMISAPDLTYLLLQCYDFLKFSANKFRSLEKADISIKLPHREDPQNIVGLFQLLHSVKDLTLNLEILEHLSSPVEIISHQHSPLSNLESLKISPLLVYEGQLPRGIVVSTEVKNYFLKSSPGATFTIVSREEIIAERNAINAKKRMAELQVHLEQEKADIETKRAHIEQENVPMEGRNALMDDEHNVLDENELQIEGNVAHINSYWESLSEQIVGNVAHINSCWESLSEQIEERKEKIDGIVRQLRFIRELLIKLPASKRAEMQPCFSSLCAQADNVMSKIRDCMKIQYDENQSRLSVCFHELSTTLQSSS